MTSGMALGGLRTDQAPPLSIPASFFLTAPLFILAASGVVATAGEEALGSTWSPAALALLHLGTLGFLGSVMLGALYQVVPVVAGAPVPIPRLAHAVHAAFTLGVACLAVGLWSQRREAFTVALALLGAAMLGFLAPIGLALGRAPARTGAVAGIRLAVAALLLTAALGVYLAYRRSGPGYLESWIALRLGHGMLGLLGWVGGLVAAVSFQVVPMFYLSPPFPRWATRGLVGLSAVSVVAIPAALAKGVSDGMIALAAIPAAAAAWAVHPAVTLNLLARRRRKIPDASLLFWRAGLAWGPLALAAAVAGAAWPDAPRPPIAMAWIAIWGWAGSIVHGMLTRIVPFITWFHRFSSVAGLRPVPPMRQLLPDAVARRGFYLHQATAVVGLVAIAVASPWSARLLAAGMAVTGLHLFLALAAVLRVRS